MKITKIIRETGEYEGERIFLEILIDGEETFSIGPGEPEDFCLHRDLSSCYGIVDMMKQAYEAGKKGEPLEIKEEKVKGWD